MRTMLFFPVYYNVLKLCNITATRITFSILSMDRLDFNTTTVSHKYTISQKWLGWVPKALLETLGYPSYFMLFQNPKSDNEDNFICSEKSDEMSINSSTVVYSINNTK